MSHNAIHRRQLPKEKPFDIQIAHEGGPSPYNNVHRHEYYEIVWPLEGTGVHCIDFVQYALKPGELYLITPGQIHETLHFKGQLCVILFQPDFLEYNYRGKLAIDNTFYQNKNNPPCLSPDDAGIHDLRDLARIMNQEIHAPKIDWDLVGALLRSFLRYLVRYIPAPQQPEALISERMYRLYSLIDLHFREQKKADFYSRQLSLTNKRVNELCRKQSGKTLTRLIHERIILEARRELAFTAKTVKTISNELGYEDTAYFCRFFRRIAEESPLEFRQRAFK